MHELFPLISFGRIGRFDLLVLLGNLGRLRADAATASLYWPG